MMRYKYPFIIMVVLSAIIMFTSCQKEPSPLEPQDAPQQELSKFSIPTGATFVSATFNIHIWWFQGIGDPGQDIDVHRITAPWDEMVVTWNNFGSSFAPEVEGSFNADTLGWYTIDVTSLVGSWLDGTNANYGLLLDQEIITGPRAVYNSRENAANHPYLEICYNLNGTTVYEQVEPFGDTYIHELFPDNNNGANTNLYTGWYSPIWDKEKQALLIFDLEPTPPQIDCEECEGKVTELTLSYLGTGPANIKVYEGKNQRADKLLFEGTLNQFDNFNFVGIKSDGTMGKEISIWVDDELNTKIHTSCSQPIGPGLISGDFEVIEGYSKYGGLLCPLPDCMECDGKVTQLTLKYHGSSTADITVEQKKDHVIVFDGSVDPGGLFSFSGTDHGTLSTEIKIFVDGLENTKIHTSCSQPIGPGLISGDFEVIEGYSKNGGKICPIPPPPGDCAECDGKVTTLTLQYDGSGGHVIVEQKKDHVVVFEGDLTTGQQFSFVGTDKGTLGTEIKLFVDGVENTKIHTSCSQPIGPGLVKGDFTVISGFSKKGGELCPIPPPGSDWCNGAKAKVLLVEYTGQDCSFTNHNQDASKVHCDGDPAFAPTVKIIAQDKENPNDPNAKIWFDGNVDLNTTFSIDATSAGESKLKAETHVFIYDLQDNLLQTIEFHTSCSQPLGAGDQFGSLLMIDFIPE